MSKLSAASLIFLSVIYVLIPSLPLAFSLAFHATVVFRLVKLFEIQVQNSQENTSISTQNNGSGKIRSYDMAIS